MEDHAIIELFFHRDENAISETDKKYGRVLNGISHSITGSVSDAEECVNDSYLAVWNAIPPTHPNSYYAFLCRIVRNISYNCFHRNTAQKRNAELLSLDTELSQIIPDNHSSTFDEIGIGKAIDQFLRILSKDARYLFVRRYFYGDSLSALSKLTGMSESSLAMRLMRIRKKLKEYLEKEGYSI